MRAEAAVRAARGRRARHDDEQVRCPSPRTPARPSPSRPRRSPPSRSPRATPMMMPSVVRNERILLRSSARTAIADRLQPVMRRVACRSRLALRDRRASAWRRPALLRRSTDAAVLHHDHARRRSSAMSGSCVTSTMVMPAVHELLEQRHHLDAGLASRGCRSARRPGSPCGCVDQRARDRDALLLAARELVRVVVERARRGRRARSASRARLWRSRAGTPA